ncbi:MAG TPA: hypothetical protein VF390_01635 [Patescibacteria group bacterium]
MKELIKIQNENLFLLNTELLGLKEAQLWIGHPDGPTDDDDERVQREREEDKAKNAIYGIEAVNLKESGNYPGWFEIDATNWPVGTYRFMLHSCAGVQAPSGTPLRNMRDGQYSWLDTSDENLLDLSEEQKKFLYLEKNKRGFCFRIKIDDNRNIEPAGDGPEGIDRWPEMQKEVAKHTETKLNN